MTQDKKKTGWNRHGFWAGQKMITSHRLWLLALILLYQIFVYPIGSALVVAGQNQNYSTSFGNETIEALNRINRQNEVACYLGLRQAFSWIPLVVGVIAGISEFAWLFSMVKMDFYESLPVSRRQHFRDLWLNGALLFSIPQWLTGFLGILVAAGMDAMNRGSFLEAVLALVMNTINFLAAYSVTILACTLCGNGIVAACLAGFFLLAEPLWKVMDLAMAGSYFVTYSSVARSGQLFYFTPATNAFAVSSRLSRYFGNSVISGAQLGSCMAELLPFAAANLVIVIAAVCLARFALVRRAAEGAGKSILYLPVREIVRILISATAAVAAGYLVDMVARSDSSYQRASVPGIIVTAAILVIVGILAAGVIQCIYEFSLRAFFHDCWSMIFAVLLGGVVMAAFAFDLTGYNRYLPKKNQIAWAALSFYQGGPTPYYDDARTTGTSGAQQDMYLADNMRLTGDQLDGLLTVAGRGQAYLVDSTQDDGSTDWNGYSANVTYHLKDGRVENRSLLIPYDIDKAAMDQILSSDAYKSAVYPVYQNGKADQYAEQGRLIYTDGIVQKEAAGGLYEAFKEAYRKDLEQYSFTLASTEVPQGYVELVYAPDNRNTPYYNYLQSCYEVYPEYTNTLAFLKEHDLYVQPVEDAVSGINGIEVSGGDDMEDTSVTYTDPDQIRTILENSTDYDMLPQWYPAGSELDLSYFLTIDVKPSLEDNIQAADSGSDFYFRKGMVPDFVRKDLTKAPGSSEDNGSQ